MWSVLCQMLGLGSELIGKPYRMPDTTVIHNLSGQWTRDDDDGTGNPSYQKDQFIYKLQLVAQKKLTLSCFSRKLKVWRVCVDRGYF